MTFNNEDLPSHFCTVYHVIFSDGTKVCVLANHFQS